jgi:hypothetical protein
MRSVSFLSLLSGLLACALGSPSARACSITWPDDADGYEYAPYPIPGAWIPPYDLKFKAWTTADCVSVTYTLGTASGTATFDSWGTTGSFHVGEKWWLLREFVDKASFETFVDASVGTGPVLDWTITATDALGAGETVTTWRELDLDWDDYARSYPDCYDDDPTRHGGPTFYFDADGDGWGDGSISMQACSAPDGYVARGGDCRDNVPGIHPHAYETCGDGFDENCDGVDGYDPAVDPASVCWAADARIVGFQRQSGYEINGGLGSDIQVGDVNGDGDADLMVANFIVNGPAAPLTSTRTAIAFTGGGPGHPVNIESVGDADGDGEDDIVVWDYEDASYLFLGPVVASQSNAAADASFLGAADTSTGEDVDIVPDVDGDGFPDIALGGAGVGPDYAGAVYVVPGAAPVGVDVTTDATYTYHGGADDFLGIHTTGLGDMNGDGLEDFAFGAAGDTPIFVVEGGGAPGAYDVRDIANATLLAADYGGYAGTGDWYAKLTSTDYDGDGTPDLLVGNGAFSFTPDAMTGNAYAFVGPFSGDLTSADAYTTWHSSAVSGLDGGQVGLAMGTLTAGDLDGDGSTDVLLGAPRSGYNGTEGVAFLQLGPSAGSVDADTLVTFGARTLLEGMGAGGAFVPDWSGDGIPELALGANSLRITRPSGRDVNVGGVYVLDSDNWSF